MVSDANGRQSEEDGVRNSLKGCTQIREDEERKSTGIGCHDQLVGNFHDPGVGAEVLVNVVNFLIETLY